MAPLTSHYSCRHYEGLGRPPHSVAQRLHVSGGSGKLRRPRLRRLRGLRVGSKRRRIRRRPWKWWLFLRIRHNCFRFLAWPRTSRGLRRRLPWLRLVLCDGLFRASVHAWCICNAVITFLRKKNSRYNS
ncbi:uncharacterized protein [Penaeus vannamei]|uniref:uncharacterized protein n=1 Tax=Penaeus vannamei TaxID=6689 RepID=UPI00387F4FBA